MPLLNYTTTVSVARTVTAIQSTLGTHGAKSVQIDYDNGIPSAIAFFVDTYLGERAYILPANVDSVWQTLVQQGRSGKVPRRFITKEQAARVAWRIIKDWTEAQMAIIETGMVSLDQVMLPYMRVGNESLYEALKSSRFALPDASRSAQ